MRRKVWLFVLFSFIPFVLPSQTTICRTYDKIPDEDAPKCASQTIFYRGEKEKSITKTPECNDCSENVARLEETVMALDQERNKTIDQNARLEQRLIQIEANLNKTKELGKSIEREFSSSKKDCSDLADQGFTKSGVYRITVDERVVLVYCDMETDGGEWLTIQRRMDGSQDFFLFWKDYVEGFGDVEREFWLGLENLHLITSSGSYQLRVDLEYKENDEAYAVYSHFSIRDSASNYRLSVSGYNGTAGDGMAYSNNRPFSTRDRDSDRKESYSCADRRKGAWWYDACTNANLNGLYQHGVLSWKGIYWTAWKTNYHSMKRAEMKIRRN